MKDAYKPDLALPFVIDRKEAIEIIRKNFAKKMFIPKDFCSTSSLESLQGRYVPFWMYDMETHVHFEGEGRKIRTWTEGDYDCTETSIYRLVRDFNVNYDKIPVDASKNMPDEKMDLVEPYKYTALGKFRSKYLSGFQAEIYDEMAPFLRRIAVQNKLISKQMQDRQRRQREFETITENMQEGLLVLDAKGEVLSCNKGARRLLGVDHVPEKENVFALNRTEGFRRCITAALAGNHEEVTMESDSRSYQLLANPVTEDGLVAGVVLLLFDNTEKADREKLRREFTANVSHELKTPLTSISGFAEIMKNGMVKAEDVPRFAHNIYDEAQRLISMVQDIIQLSRLDEAQETMEKTEVIVSLIAETVAKRLEGQAAQRNIVFHIETESAVLSGVPHVLEEMIYNLCDNAIRYNKDNGSVTLKVEKHPDDITVTVADTGIGIPYGEQERVFERFYRVSRSRSKEIDGTGLGLSIVKHGALLHQATVKMESEVDKGTTIRLIFPNK